MDSTILVFIGALGGALLGWVIGIGAFLWIARRYKDSFNMAQPAVDPVARLADQPQRPRVHELIRIYQVDAASAHDGMIEALMDYTRCCNWRLPETADICANCYHNPACEHFHPDQCEGG